MSRVDGGLMGRYARPLAPRLDELRSAPLGLVLGVLSLRWSVLTMRAIATGHSRFNGLHRALDGISHKVLIETLRALERDGFVVGPRTGAGSSYELTALGGALLSLIDEVDRWACRHAPEILVTRRDFDGRSGGYPGGE